ERGRAGDQNGQGPAEDLPGGQDRARDVQLPALGRQHAVPRGHVEPVAIRPAVPPVTRGPVTRGPVTRGPVTRGGTTDAFLDRPVGGAISSRLCGGGRKSRQ